MKSFFDGRWGYANLAPVDQELDDWHDFVPGEREAYLNRNARSMVYLQTIGE